MIQDIAPRNFDINFKQKTPSPDSKVIILSEGKIFLLGETQKINFPLYKDVNANGYELQFLFQLDEEDFFRLHIEKTEDVEKVYALSEGMWKIRHELRETFPREYTLVAATAMHLDGWYQKNRFCGACGEKTVFDEKERMLRCPKCKNMIFPRINPAVIVGVTNGDKLLMTKYRGREYTHYALVAGFTEIGESFEQCVAREVMEETGVKVKNIRYYASQPWALADDILAGYYCDVDGSDTIKMDDDELSVAEWLHRDDIPDRPDDLSLTSEMIMNFKYHKEQFNG